MHPSERYTTAVACGGRAFLFSRRLVLANGSALDESSDANEWITVVRRGSVDGHGLPLSYGPASETLEARMRLSHNLVVYCHDANLVALGGRFRPKRRARSTLGYARELGVRRTTADAATCKRASHTLVRCVAQHGQLCTASASQGLSSGLRPILSSLGTSYTVRTGSSSETADASSTGSWALYGTLTGGTYASPGRICRPQVVRDTFR